jgi:hypothetical protein
MVWFTARVPAGRAAGSAGLLRVVIGEGDTFPGDAVDVGRLVAHHATAVVADVPRSDVVTPDDEDIGLLGLPRGGRREGD